MHTILIATSRIHYLKDKVNAICARILVAWMTIYRSEREGQKHSMSQRSGEKNPKNFSQVKHQMPCCQTKISCYSPRGCSSRFWHSWLNTFFCLTAILTWSTSENNASRKKTKHPFCQIFQYPLFFTTMAEGKRRKISKLAIHHLQLLRAAHFSKCWRRLLSFCFCK